VNPRRLTPPTNGSVGEGIGGAKARIIGAKAPMRVIEFIILKDLKRKKIEENDEQKPAGENGTTRKKGRYKTSGLSALLWPTLNRSSTSSYY
jgi:hypothetical protein